MKMWKRALSLGLVLTMAVGLCACKGGKGLPGGGNGPQGGGGKGTSADPSLAKQFVYAMDRFDLSGVQEEGSDSYVQKAIQLGDRIYIIVQCYNWQQNPNGPIVRIISMKTDGSDIKSCRLQESMGGAGQDGETDGRTGADEAGTAKKPGAGDMDGVLDGDGEDIDGDFDMPYMPDNVYEYTNLSSFQVTKDGQIVGVKGYNYENYSDPENPERRNETYICLWDMDGNMMSEILLENLQSDESWSYVNGVFPQDDGSMAILISGDQMGVRIMKEDGSLSALKPMKALESAMERSSGWTVKPDGTFVVSYSGEDWRDSFISTYDFKTDTLSEGIKLPQKLQYCNLNSYVISDNDEFYFCYNQDVYRYHIGDADAECVMSFINSDLEMNNLDQIIALDKDHFMGLYTEYNETTYHSVIGGGIFTRVDPADIPDKQVLVLGGIYVPNDLRKRAVEFNKSSSTHRIVLRDYSEYITYDEEWNADNSKFNNDIISGNMPDILVADGYNVPVDMLVSKGLLADIGALMEKDEEISKIEYLDNVFEACKIDGKLYEVIPTFYVITYVAKTSLVGDRKGWTMEEALELTNSMPNAHLFGDLTRPAFFNMMMTMCGNDFIDVSTGKCDFNTPEFISLMEFAKTLPEEYNEDYYNDENWYTSYQTQYREDRTILANCYISSFRDMVYTINGMFGEDVTYVGFPTSSGTGTVIHTNISYLLSSKSANLDAAWEFMRYYLTEDYQSSLQWQLPVAKKPFEEYAKMGMEKPYYLDENGEKVEYDDYYWINDEQIMLSPLNQKQVDDIKELVMSVNKRAYYNQDVMKIISEEMDAFYKGQKSAADVAGIIQSRANIYVNENR